MVKILSMFVVIAALSFQLFSQEKQKARLLDEFGKLPRKDIVKRIEKLRSTLHENAGGPQYADVFILLWATTQSELKERRDAIVSTLYDNCRDCMGDTRITFVDRKLGKETKTQIWLVPPGGEPPSLDQ